MNETELPNHWFQYVKYITMAFGRSRDLSEWAMPCEVYAWNEPAQVEDWEAELEQQNAFLPIDFFWILPLHALNYIPEY